MDPLRIEPLHEHNWDDLEELFGKHGAYAGCWCMYWRITGRQFASQAGRGTRAALRSLAAEDAAAAPGLLAYRGTTPVGWCSVGPREAFGRLERSPHLRRIDDERGVWAVVCFYVGRSFRGQGVSRALLDAAVDYAAAQGARIVEGYPSVVGDERVASSSLYQGTLEMFLEAGFVEAARRAHNRPIMRCHFAGALPREVAAPGATGHVSPPETRPAARRPS
jgi:GNAT superfamily N-acetyltransferase